MVHSIVLKFEKIWLSGTLIIIRKPKVWRTDGHEDPYIPPNLVDREYNSSENVNIKIRAHDAFLECVILHFQLSNDVCVTSGAETAHLLENLSWPPVFSGFMLLSLQFSV
jgi:hypothetical protein